MAWSQQRGQNFGKVVEKFGYRCFFYRQPKAKCLRTPDKEQAIIAESQVTARIL